MIGFKPRDKARAAPNFHGGAVNPLASPDQCVFVVATHEATKINEVPVSTNLIDPVLGHYGCTGDRSPGEDSHSLMRDAVSACRAFLKSNSRSMPAGSEPAFSRSRAASLAKRCSKSGLCLRFHLMGKTPPPRNWNQA
jgi:hypothetical protein